MQQPTMIFHKIPDGKFRIVTGFNDIGVLCYLRERHRKSLAYRSDLFYGDLYFFGDLIVGDIRIFGGIFANFKVQIGIGPGYFYQPRVVAKVV